MRSLLPLFLIFALSLYALVTWASDGDLDNLGCHLDAITESYHCHSGILEGREFMNAEEAAAALKAEQEKKAKDKEDEEFAASYTVPLRLMSWNFSSIGTTRFEYDRVAGVLADADFAVLQEVEFSRTGETSLTIIADLLSRKLNQRICKAWFKSAGGERGRHAFLWKDKVISYVGKTGAIEDRCPDGPVVIRTETKKIEPNDPLTSTFYLKTRRQMFNAVAVQFEKKPKKAAKEIAAIFGKLSQLPWPAVVAGNFKIAAGDGAFKDAVKLNFKPVISRSGNATSNVWTKNLSVVHAEAIDLNERFSELKPKEVEALISSFPPLLAEISFSSDEAQALQMQLVKRSAKRAKAARKEAYKARPAKPEPKPLSVHDDLEKEAED